MKKTLTLILALAMVVSAMGMTAFAADPTSEASITFTKGDIEIVEPTDPEYKALGSKDIEFADTAITGGAQNINTMKAGSETLGLAITNASGNQASTWNVTVKAGEFEVGTAPTDPKLTGYKLTLTPDATKTVGPTATSAAPTTNPNKPIQTASAIELTAGTAAQKIYENGTGGSLGTWGDAWTPELDILPATAQSGVLYSATMTWTMAAVA